MSTRLCAPYSSYSERRYLPSHDARAITMVEPQTDDNTPPRKRIAVAVSPAPALYPPPLSCPSKHSHSHPLSTNPHAISCFGSNRGYPWRVRKGTGTHTYTDRY